MTTARSTAACSHPTGEPSSPGTAPSPVSALIADDEPHLARALAAELARLWPELQVVHVARNGVEAAERIAALQPDLAFLDIQMPGLTGLEVAQGIEGRTRVVFVTAYDEYAVQAFEQEALDYVLKPVKADRLQRTLDRVQRALALPVADDSAQLLAALKKLVPAGAASTPAERLRWVRASSGELTHQVAVQDVLFFHADDKYTCVRTASAEHLIRTPSRNWLPSWTRPSLCRCTAPPSSTWPIWPARGATRRAGSTCGSRATRKNCR